MHAALLSQINLCSGGDKFRKASRSLGKFIPSNRHDKSLRLFCGRSFERGSISGTFPLEIYGRLGSVYFTNHCDFFILMGEMPSMQIG